METCKFLQFRPERLKNMLTRLTHERHRDPLIMFTKGSQVRIPTSRGPEILIDDEDWDIVKEYSWYANRVGNGRFYAHARSGKTRISMHRLLMNPPEGMVVHHKNNNGLDNRRDNLEVTTQSYNCRAARHHRAVGVHMHKKTGTWRAQLRIDGKMVSFGLHQTREDAEKALEEVRRMRDGL